MATIGVPIKVLHEAEGHIVTIETTTGNHRQIQIDRQIDNQTDTHTHKVLHEDEGHIVTIESTTGNHKPRTNILCKSEF